MSYKQIAAASHNWTASFMSSSSYIEAGRTFIAAEFSDWMRKHKRDVIIEWIPENNPEDYDLFNQNMKSGVQIYREALPDHLHRQNIEPQKIQSLRTELICKKDRFVIFAYAKDDKGKEHRQEIPPYREKAVKWRD